MANRTIVENRVWNAGTSAWVVTAPTTHAKAVETSDGGNVQDKLDGIPAQITSSKDGAISELRGGVAAAGNTLSKLYSLITALQELVQSDDVSLDTVQEIANYIKANRQDLTLMGTNKVNYTDIVNNVTTSSGVEGKTLDARQGKVLKDLIDALTTGLSSLQTQADGFVTTEELNNGLSSVTSSARLILTDTAPSSPADGQVWFKPAGVIDV